MTERLPLKDAADRLGVSVNTVRRRIAAGTLPAEQEPTTSGFRYVVLFETPDALPVTPPAASAVVDPAFAEVRAERDWLRAQVEELTKQLANAQVLIGQAQVARLPARTQTSTQNPDQPAYVSTQTSTRRGEAQKRPAGALRDAWQAVWRRIGESVSGS